MSELTSSLVLVDREQRIRQFVSGEEERETKTKKVLISDLIAVKVADLVHKAEALGIDSKITLTKKNRILQEAQG